jgi:hypothetical protein
VTISGKEGFKGLRLMLWRCWRKVCEVQTALQSCTASGSIESEMDWQILAMK